MEGGSRTEWSVSLWSRNHVLADRTWLEQCLKGVGERGLNSAPFLFPQLLPSFSSESSSFFLLLTATFNALRSGCHSPCLWVIGTFWLWGLTSSPESPGFRVLLFFPPLILASGES